MDGAFLRAIDMRYHLTAKTRYRLGGRNRQPRTRLAHREVTPKESLLKVSQIAGNDIKLYDLLFVVIEKGIETFVPSNIS